MNRADFDAYCKTLKASTHVIQWRGASVWKVGGKIFAISVATKDKKTGTRTDKTSFKCSDLSYRILIEQLGIIPAPYLARAKWVQIEDPDAMTNGDLKTYLDEAYSIISAKLTKAKQRELDLIAQ